MALTWTQKGSLRGPAGAKGDPGDPGATGAGYRTCSVTLTADSDVDTSNISPSAGLQIGDLLVDPTGAVFPVASVGEGTAHTGTATGQNLRGPQGAQGPQGPQGQQGVGVPAFTEEDEGKFLTVRDGETVWSVSSGGSAFTIGHGLLLEDNVLSVNVVNDAEKDNTLPITSAAVYTTVGNIDSLLQTI